MLRKLQFLYKKKWKTLDLFDGKIGNFDHLYEKSLLGTIRIFRKNFQFFEQKIKGDLWEKIFEFREPFPFPPLSTYTPAYKHLAIKVI